MPDKKLQFSNVAKEPMAAKEKSLGATPKVTSGKICPYVKHKLRFGTIGFRTPISFTFISVISPEVVNSTLKALVQRARGS